MSSLTDVIAMVANINVNSCSPLQWDNEELAERLRLCFTAQEITQWHCELLERVRTRHPNHPSLETLCIGVSNCLARAATRLEQLLLWTTGNFRLSDDVCTDRQIAISSLEDIMEALHLFDIVRTNENLQSPRKMEIVRKYLQKTYAFMILCSWIVLDSTYEDWLYENAAYLNITQLRDFKFDNEDDREQLSNPTLTGVIFDSQSVPSSCLPDYPQRPVLCQNPGLYGNRILPNRFSESRP